MHHDYIILWHFINKLCENKIYHINVKTLNIKRLDILTINNNGYYTNEYL